ncbi:MAG: hypothetical protein DRI65_13135 [Chloroflexota bacterium]|nr:MAG: hypothetical protein DRI65_13135 [Chloroflexota bacterium]HDD61841.1 hypothetical protein [Chloroflexota bacterium]
MGSFSNSMDEFKKRVLKGDIIVAYQGLMNYFGYLKSHFRDEHPGYDVSGGTYFGYMDMTYFPIFTETLKKRGLKIALVFVYETFRFEVWLAAKNKKIQNEYRQIFTDSGWKKYHITAAGKEVDSILDSVLVEDPDFSDLDSLTKQIRKATQEFISDIEDFLSVHEN